MTGNDDSGIRAQRNAGKSLQRNTTFTQALSASASPLHVQLRKLNSVLNRHLFLSSDRL